MTKTTANGITLRQIRAFLSVARYGAFTRAAEVVGLSQPALTACIRHLEDQLGVTLFERTTRRVDLTPYGTEFLPYATRIVRELDDAMLSLRAISSGQSGRVTMASIGSIASSVLPEALAAFKLLHPGVGVEVGQDHSEGVRRKVLEGEAEFGLSGSSADLPDLKADLFFSDPIGLFCRVDHPLGHLGRALRWTDLGGYEILNMGYEEQIMSVADLASDVAIRLSAAPYKVRNAHAVTALLKQGDSIAVMPLMSIPSSLLSDLTFLPLTEPELHRDIFLCYPRRGSLSTSARALIGAVLTSARNSGGTIAPQTKGW